MCGLVGMMGNFYAKHEKMMKYMLLFDTLRGPHSTGLAAVDKDRDIDFVKKTIPGWDFIEDPIIDRLLSCTDKVWIGHNRFATIGKINRLNAHPFTVEDANSDPIFVGAHNGTIQNRNDIDNAYSFGTDSEGLMNMIVNQGPKDAIAKMRGAWALSWFDKRTDCVHFLRNKERPLFFAYVGTSQHVLKNKEVIAWASEAWMIEVAAERAELDISKMYYFEENTLFSFEIPKKVGGELKLRSEGGFEGAPPAPFQGSTTVGRGSGGATRTGTNQVSTYGTRWINNVCHLFDQSKQEWRPAEWDNALKRHVLIKEAEETATQVSPQEAIEMRRTQTSNSGGENKNSSTKPKLIELPMGSSSQQDNEKSGTGLEEPSRTRNPILSTTASKTLQETKKSTPSSKKSSSSGKDKEGGHVLNFRVKGFQGQLVSPDAAKEIFAHGCSWCGDDIEMSGVFPKTPVAWMDATHVVCKNCESDIHPKPDDYTGLFDNELDKVAKGHAKFAGKEVVLREAGLTREDIDRAINGKELQEEARMKAVQGK